MSTIKDVSKRTGLSLATISKYLNGGNVREKNRQVIDEAVEALGFRVNRNARSLKTNRTMTVGVVIPTLTIPFFGEVLSALDKPALPGKPTLLLCHTVKGKGVSYMENQVGWHGKAPNDEQRKQALAELEG